MKLQLEQSSGEEDAPAVREQFYGFVGRGVIECESSYAPIVALKKCHPTFLYRGGRPGSAGDSSPRTRGSVLHLLATAKTSIQTELK